MRIISGRFGGRSLRAPRSSRTRPTTDRVKESLFAPLHFDLAGASVLDVFGGTGALGIEAFSRGAARVVIIEKAHGAMRTVRENWKAVGSPEEITLMEMSWQTALEMLEGQPPFSFVFLDPPYSSGLYAPVMEKLAHCRLIDADTLLILESDDPPNLALPDFTEVRQRRYGTVYITWEKYTPGRRAG